MIEPSLTIGPIDAAYVQIRLEEAGRTLAMLPASGCFPMKHVSTWPEYLREWEDMRGDNLEPEPVRLRPTMKQMNELAEVAEWLVLLAKYCDAKKIKHVARCVGYGMLRWPDSDRPRYPWVQLAKLVRCNDKTAKVWYEQGVEIIVRILNTEALADRLDKMELNIGGRNG